MTGISTWRRVRTPLLGLTALGMLLWMAVDQFDVPLYELGEMALGALLFVGVIVFAALLGALLLRFLRR